MPNFHHTIAVQNVEDENDDDETMHDSTKTTVELLEHENDASVPPLAVASPERDSNGYFIMRYIYNEPQNDEAEQDDFIEFPASAELTAARPVPIN